MYRERMSMQQILLRILFRVEGFNEEKQYFFFDFLQHSILKHRPHEKLRSILIISALYMSVKIIIAIFHRHCFITIKPGVEAWLFHGYTKAHVLLLLI